MWMLIGGFLLHWFYTILLCVGYMEKADKRLESKDSVRKMVKQKLQSERGGTHDEKVGKSKTPIQLRLRKLYRYLPAGCKPA